MNHEQHTELLPLGDIVSQFDVVLRGYDRGQVHEHVDRLETDLRVALSDRDLAASRSADLAAQLAAAHGEIEALRTKMQRLELPTPENIGERVRHMLALAEEEANEIRSRAHDETAALQSRADRLSAEIEAKHGEADGYANRLVSEAEQRATTILAEAEQRATAMLAEAEQRARLAVADAQREQERRNAEAEAKRRQADEDFDIALRARRAEQAGLDEERRGAVARECEQRLTGARAEAEQRLTAAHAEADRLVAGAHDQLNLLRMRRRQVLDQLAAIRGALEGLPSADALEEAERGTSQQAAPSHSPARGGTAPDAPAQGK